MAESSDERWLKVTFLAERDESENDEYVRFSYLDRSIAQIRLRQDWWVSLGQPEAVEVTVEPSDES